MGEESRKIELCLVGVGVVWVLSVVLLAAETATGADVLGRWGLWLALVAVSWTVHILLCRAKASVIRSIAREIAFANRPAEEATEVRHLR